MSNPINSFLAVAALASTVAFIAPKTVKWPARLSFEAPVSSTDPAVRGAVMLVRGMLREGVPQPADFVGSAEGLVDGTRETVSLRFQATREPGVVALNRQWPTEGTWIFRVSLRSTVRLVTLGSDGRVA